MMETFLVAAHQQDAPASLFLLSSVQPQGREHCKCPFCLPGCHYQMMVSEFFERCLLACG